MNHTSTTHVECATNTHIQILSRFLFGTCNTTFKYKNDYYCCNSYDNFLTHNNCFWGGGRRTSSSKQQSPKMIA